MGLHRTTMYRYCMTEQLNCIKMNRKIFIRKSDLELIFEHHAPYAVTHTERKSKQHSKQKAESRVVNTPSKSAIVSASPPSDGDWYTTSEVYDKYDITRTAVYSLVYEHGTPKVKSGNATYYAKSVIDTPLSCRQPDSSIYRVVFHGGYKTAVWSRTRLCFQPHLQESNTQNAGGNKG